MVANIQDYQPLDLRCSVRKVLILFKVTLFYSICYFAVFYSIMDIQV